MIKDEIKNSEENENEELTPLQQFIVELWCRELFGETYILEQNKKTA